MEIPTLNHSVPIPCAFTASAQLQERTGEVVRDEIVSGQNPEESKGCCGSCVQFIYDILCYIAYPFVVCFQWIFSWCRTKQEAPEGPVASSSVPAVPNTQAPPSATTVDAAKRQEISALRAEKRKWENILRSFNEDIDTALCERLGLRPAEERWPIAFDQLPAKDQERLLKQFVRSCGYATLKKEKPAEYEPSETEISEWVAVVYPVCHQGPYKGMHAEKMAKNFVRDLQKDTQGIDPKSPQGVPALLQEIIDDVDEQLKQRGG